MVKQYIGARYVPLFFENAATGDSTWSPNTAYDPLTIVTWSGNSYTSKKPVPPAIGNPANNPSYWVATGIYNEQVETIRQEVETLASTSIKKKLSDCKIVCVGDSYGQGYTPESESAANGWPRQMQTIYGIPDDNIKIRCIGGVGFANSTPDGGFGGIAASWFPSIADDEVDAVIVAGGWNDNAHSSAEILAGMTAFKTAAEAAFPNAQIWVAFIGWSTDATVQNRLVHTFEAYSVNAYKLGLMYCQGVENVLLNVPLMSSDGIHPLPLGNNRIASAIGNCMAGCGYDNTVDVSIGDCVPESGWSFTQGAAQNGVRLGNGMFTYKTYQKVLKRTNNDPVTVSGNAGEIPLFTVPGMPKSGDESGTHVQQFATCLIQYVDGGNNKYKYVPCGVGFVRNVFTLTLYNTNAAMSNWESLDVVQVTLPTMCLPYIVW